MSTKHYDTGRQRGYLIVDKLLKEQQKSFEAKINELDKGLFSKPETKQFLQQSLSNFFTLALKDLERLKNGETTKDIRNIESKKIAEEQTEIAEKAHDEISKLNEFTRKINGRTMS